MFDANSRYARLPTTTLVRADGRTITYVTRRFLPQGEDLPVLVALQVNSEDRLDLIANRADGVPEAFWLVADANNAMNPAELLDEPATTVVVPIPQP